MARIRSIKPEFFRHYRLFELEAETGLPLRVAFSALWCAADREGRFEWVPPQLKVECLPYDDVDFSRVLDALATRGFVVKYEVDGREFGFIPGFTKHQVINNRERASDLPKPPDTKGLTRDARVNDASTTRDARVPQGREGKGTGIPVGGQRPERQLSETIFGECLAYLTEHGAPEKQARSELGKWRKRVGDAEVVNLVSRAQRESVTEPIAWIESAMKPSERKVLPL